MATLSYFQHLQMSLNWFNYSMVGSVVFWRSYCYCANGLKIFLILLQYKFLIVLIESTGFVVEEDV